jgi:hypothetical protein
MKVALVAIPLASDVYADEGSGSSQSDCALQCLAVKQPEDFSRTSWRPTEDT